MSRDHSTHDDAGGLQRALGLPDPWLARVLRDFGFDDTCAPILPWLPACAVGWIDGLTMREHERLTALIMARHGQLSPRAARLLIAWLAHPPPPSLVRVGRRALEAQHARLPAAEREALRALVIGPCVEVARASGGAFGFGAISAAESAAIRQLSDRLPAPPTASGRSPY